MVLFHIPRPASNVESQATDKWYLKTAFVRYVQPMNVSPVPWSCHPPGSLREGEREWTILRLHQRSFPVFGLILCLRGGHEYSSKHRSSFFKKRNFCQYNRHSCFNWSISVERNRQELLGVAREVQNFRHLPWIIGRFWHGLAKLAGCLELHMQWARLGKLGLISE